MADIGRSEFDVATAMTGADGGWGGRVLDGWDIGGNANGGYVLALAVRAMVEAVGRPHPITVTAHFLSPVRPGPVSIRPAVVKSGRRFATATGTLVGADGRELIAVLGAFGDADFDDSEGFELIAGDPPQLAPFEDCPVRDRTNGPAMVGIVDRLNLRLDPSCAGYQDGGSGRGEMIGWFGFADGRPTDPLALMLACDAFPPAVFHLDTPPGWVPTIELTVHVRAVPAHGPLRCRFVTRFISNGRFEEDGELWDSAGRLVAMSRQIGLLARA